MIGHITYLSEQSMHEKFGRALRHGTTYSYDFNSEFAVETYLDYQGQRFVERFDANSYLYITKAMDYFDPVAGHESLAETFAGVTSRFLFASFTSDWLFPPKDSQQMVRALLSTGKDVTYANIVSPYGHDAFLLEVDVLGGLVANFLASSLRKLRTGRAVLPWSAEDAAATAARHGRERVDFPVFKRLIPRNSRVLDLGCGHGSLLQFLSHDLDVRGFGVEIDQARLLDGVRRGLSVIHHDLDQGLPEFPDASFDFVILSQTLPEVRYPEMVLREMLRIGRYAIVSIPNFAHWQARLQLAALGRAPVTAQLPQAWYETERIRFLSLRDFEHLCDRLGVRIVERWALGRGGRRVRGLANLFAEQALYVITSARK